MKLIGKITSIERTCARCKKFRKFSRFSKNKLYPCGVGNRCKDCRNVYMRGYCRKNKKKRNLSQISFRAKIRVETLLAYGGKCVCCGFDDLDFLTIDHIGGKKESPRLSKNQSQEFVILKRLEYPRDKFRVLCHNCNIASRFTKVCPHEKRKKKIV